MIILIDAYNLIKQVLEVSRVSDDQINKFINELKKYSKKKNHHIVLVFDGGFQSFPIREIDGLVEIVYVGYGHSADDFIKDYLEKNHKRDLILVSSDLELKNKAKSLSVEAFDVFEFYNKVKELFEPFDSAQGRKKIDYQAQGSLQKISDESDAELDELMMLDFSAVPLKKEDLQFKIKSQAKNIPKKEKKREMILRKL